MGRRDLEPPIPLHPLHRLLGVEDQIRDNLGELVGIALNGREIRGEPG